MALTYRTNQAYSDTFTYQGGGGGSASVVAATANVATTAYDAAFPAPITLPSSGRKPRGGATFIRRVADKSAETPAIESKIPELAPLSLRSQYDALLESGEISADEWVGLLMVHGVDPVQMVLT